MSREPRPTMAVAEIEDRVGRFVAASFLPDGADPPGPADDLFALLDSLQGLRTVAWLEEAYSERSTALPSLKVNPLYDSLRDDDRFHALMRRVGILHPSSLIPNP